MKQEGDIRAARSTKISYRSVLNLLRIFFLVLLDSLMLSVAWIVAQKLGTSTEELLLLSMQGKEAALLTPIAAITVGVLAASGLYGTDDQRRNFPSLMKAITLSHVMILVLAFLYQPGVWVSRSSFLLAWLLSLIFVFSERLALHLAIMKIRSQKRDLRDKIFLLGDLEDVENAKKLVDKSKQFNILGTADLSVRDDKEKWQEVLKNIRRQNVSEVFICSWQSVKDPVILFWELKSAGIRLRVLPVSLELPRQWSEIKMIGRVTTIRFSNPPLIGSDFWFKRAFDLLSASIILLIISIPMLLIALMIKLDSPGPIFYKQTRVGLKNRHFKVWKFRTMVINASELQKELEAKNEIKGGVLFKMKDDPRITKVGKFLRRYSLDELPQLINVVRGEMSLVGPRPLPVRDVEKFSQHHFMRHEVLPGITGLWQVSGRSDVDAEEVFYLDMAYIQHWSLALDFKILLQTIKVVLGKEGAY